MTEEDKNSKKENPRRELIPIKGRMWFIGFSLSKIPKKLRGEAAENIISVYMNTLGMRVGPRKKKCQDRIAIDPATKNEVPVQVKSISTEKHGYEIRVDEAPLNEFEGYYLVLLEHEPEDIILHIESGEVQRRIRAEDKKTPGKARHHKDYRSLYIPANLKGFEQYVSPDEFKEAVFGKRKGN